MVTDYNRGQRYMVGDLKPFICLLPTSDNPSSTSQCLISYTVDEGKATVQSISGSPYRLECKGVSMTSEESFAGRFKFRNKVTATFSEWGNYLPSTLLGEKFKVVVEDMDGNQFIASLDFAASITWKFEVGTTNNFTVEFTCDSNFPSLYVEEKITDYGKVIGNNCMYTVGGAEELLMVDWASAYMVRSDDSLISVSTATPFASIHWLKGTFSFTQEYDGSNYKDTLSFSIPLSEYKSYWHYNIIEFKSNRYVALFRTSNGNVFSSGFDNGLFPSYTITTGEGASSPNIIRITFTSVSGNGMAWAEGSNLDGLIDSDGRVSYSSVKPFYSGNTLYQTFMCTGVGTAVNTLMEEVTVKGEGLGRYWVLQGHRSDFEGAGLNIVGEYNETDGLGGMPVTTVKNECSSYGQCAVSGIPYALEFSKSYTSATITIDAACNWSVTSKPDWITVVPDSGSASTQVTITVDTAVGKEVEGDIVIDAGGGKHVIHAVYSPFVDWRTQLDENGGIEYFCYGDNSYVMLVKWVSTDGVNWTKTDTVKAGDLVNLSDSRCMQYEYISDTERWVLEDNKYMCEEKQEEEPTPPVVNDKNNLLYSATSDAYVRVNGNNIKLPAGENQKAYLGSSIESMVFFYTEGPTYNIGLTMLDFSNLDLSNLDNGNYIFMFMNCKDLASIVFGPNFMQKDGVSQTDYMFYGCLKLASVDMGSWKLGGITTMTNMFNNCPSLSNITFPSSEIAPTGMSYAFANCGKLKKLDICNVSAANLTAYSAMFSGTVNLNVTANTEFIKKATEGTYPTTLLFTDCTPVVGNNILKYTRGNGDNWVIVNGEKSYLTSGSEKSLVSPVNSLLFNDDTEENSLTMVDVSGVDTSSLTDINGMFKGLKYLRSVNAFMKTGAVVPMKEVFSGCKMLTSIDVSSWDTSTCNTMVGMFFGCSGLTSINVTSFVTDNVQDFSEMFAGCSSITELDLGLFETSSATKVRNMFYSCEKLESLNAERFDMVNVTDMVGMFENCYALRHIRCSQSFKDWCEANKDDLAFSDYSSIVWDIVR